MIKRFVAALFAALLVSSTSITSFAATSTTPVEINNHHDVGGLYFQKISTFNFFADMSGVELVIRTYKNCSITAEIEVKDTFGNVVKSYRGSNNGSSISLNINRSYSLSSGSYTATCTANAGGEVYTETIHF